MSAKIIQALKAYTACDVSDALLKMKFPRGGLLPGVTMWSPVRQTGNTKVVGPAYTVKFVLKAETSAPRLAQHHIDTIPPGAVVFLSAPAGTVNAVYGGLMSRRAKYSQAAGTIIDGNFRDLDEHVSIGYPVFARNLVTPPYYEVVRASEVDVPVTFQDKDTPTVINPGDYIIADLNGVVVLPQGMAEEALGLMQIQAEMDSKMAIAIDQGSTFAAASAQFRGK